MTRLRHNNAIARFRSQPGRPCRSQSRLHAVPTGTCWESNLPWPAYHSWRSPAQIHVLDWTPYCEKIQPYTNLNRRACNRLLQVQNNAQPAQYRSSNTVLDRYGNEQDNQSFKHTDTASLIIWTSGLVIFLLIISSKIFSLVRGNALDCKTFNPMLFDVSKIDKTSHLFSTALAAFKDSFPKP